MNIQFCIVKFLYFTINFLRHLINFNRNPFHQTLTETRFCCLEPKNTETELISNILVKIFAMFATSMVRSFASVESERSMASR